MRTLACSNIAWETSEMDLHLAILRDGGAHGLELSPSMVWPEPNDVPDGEWKAFGKRVADYGLSIVSAHSLTYPRPDLTFYDSDATRSALEDYIVRLAEKTALVGCPHLVFGSSRSRQIGDRDPAVCRDILASSFRTMASRMADCGVRLLVEPLSRRETDCITSLDEAAILAEQIDHENFGLHVDLKSCFAESEDLAEVWPRLAEQIYHVHVADPGLRPPSAACAEHAAAAAAMQAAGYTGCVSIEMGRSFGDTQAQLRDALDFVRRIYL